MYTLMDNNQLIFAVNQQEYLQGYLSLVYMTLWASTHQQPITSLLRTGPVITTARPRVRATNVLGDIHLDVICNADAGDNFWAVVENGVSQAAIDMVSHSC